MSGKNFSRLIALLMLFASGCYRGSNPLAPAPDALQHFAAPAYRTHIWGYYTIYLDLEHRKARAVPSRNTLFTANVVSFLNGSMSNLLMNNMIVTMASDHADVSLNIGLRHPLPDMPQYNGYDVRGAFICDGSTALKYNSKLTYPVRGTNQFMFQDPSDGAGGT